MIYTLNILTERVLRRLHGSDIPHDSPYDPDFIKVELKDAAREDLKLEIKEKRGGNEDDRTPITTYIATYTDVEVKLDKPTNRVYIDLPSTYMTLKYNKAIVISPMKRPNHRMIPVANPGVTSHLPHADFERDNYGFYTEGLKVFFMRDIKSDKIEKVLLKLTQPIPDDWGDDEELPLIGENVARILDIVVQRMLNKMPQDRLNDGNPNLRANNA
jgi:hypothetical protein